MNVAALIQDANRFRREVGRWFYTGASIVSLPQREHRLGICRGCDELAKDQCKQCNCYMPLKTWLSSSECPLGKWPSDEEPFWWFSSIERVEHLAVELTEWRGTPYSPNHQGKGIGTNGNGFIDAVLGAVGAPSRDKHLQVWSPGSQFTVPMIGDVISTSAGPLMIFVGGSIVWRATRNEGVIGSDLTNIGKLEAIYRAPALSP
jgi:hypothetical protein